MRERVRHPSPDSLTDAGYLLARLWKAAGPLWMASSLSVSVRGPQSAGSDGSVKVLRGLELPVVSALSVGLASCSL